MPVRWDLLRHGLAEPDRGEGDDGRRLSPEGASAVRALGKRLGARGWRPARALSSPLRRAVETAEHVLEAAGVALEVDTIPELEPGREPEEVVRLLTARQAEAHHWLLVGHQPLMGRLLEHLTGTTAPVPPGTLFAVQFDGPIGPRRGRFRPTA